MFHTADPKDILDGKITDVYFDRALRVLKAKGINKRVKAEFIAKGFPNYWPWAVLAGIEEAAYLLKGLNVKVRSMKEGTVIYPYEPVMEIEGSYNDFCVYETAVLGLLCQASGVATKAARFKRLADNRLVASFGARRMHPILAPMIERNAYIGGCDGVSVVKSGEFIGEDPTGTMPHALIICMGSTVEAIKAFDEIMEPEIKRVALIDTFLDEKFECLNVAEAMGDRLYAVRFDTPYSRRGDLYRIIEEARWELDLRGFKHVKIFVSGGIQEEDVPVLNPLVDAYGIGTSISNAPVVDFAMDIIEVDGKPVAKRGKWSGAKSVLRCWSCLKDVIVPYTEEEMACECGGRHKELLLPFVEDGEILWDLPKLKDIRKRVLEQVERIWNP